MDKWYKTTAELYQQILVVEGIENPMFDEVVQVQLPGGTTVAGQVLEAHDGKAIVQLFDNTDGMNLDQLKAKFTGRPLQLGVSERMLGRVFSGLGKPIDGGPEIVSTNLRSINGAPVNPEQRDLPSSFIQTGVSAIDGLNPLVRGQKLPIFSAAGLPHSQLAAQIVRNAKIRGEDKSEKFVVVFGAMGVTKAEADFFIEDLRRSGSLVHTVAFINLASDPVVERITLPRVALTAAEHLAYDLGMHVLVVLTDMTNYCNALREISAARKEVPGRRGYPGYLYTDLASIYERAGRIKGHKGSVTQLPILTMPDGDKTHPIPDLTGYITEGQIVLAGNLLREGVNPPIDALASLSRLKDKGIGEGKTREDHSSLLDQLFAAYAKGKDLRDLARVLGESSLSEVDQLYLQFANNFDEQYISQDWRSDRDVEATLDLGWKLLSILPRNQLKRAKPAFIDKYMPAEVGDTVNE